VDEQDRPRSASRSTRGRLHALAYRMLGSLSVADDAVEEAWLWLSRSDTSEVENLGAWLTTVVARVSLSMLRARAPPRGADEHPPPRSDRGSRGWHRSRSRGGGGRLGRARVRRDCVDRRPLVRNCYIVPFRTRKPLARAPSRSRQRCDPDPANGWRVCAAVRDLEQPLVAVAVGQRVRHRPGGAGGRSRYGRLTGPAVAGLRSSRRTNRPGRRDDDRRLEFRPAVRLALLRPAGIRTARRQLAAFCMGVSLAILQP
jgi:hypothetical protein